MMQHLLQLLPPHLPLHLQPHLLLLLLLLLLPHLLLQLLNLLLLLLLLLQPQAQVDRTGMSNLLPQISIRQTDCLGSVQLDVPRLFICPVSLMCFSMLLSPVVLLLPSQWLLCHTN
jgi:hypothetical protein